MAVLKSNAMIISSLMILTINLAFSGEHSGILSSLYKKAAQSNRPLILVLDNTNHENIKGVPKVKSYQSSGEKDTSISDPFTYLYKLAHSHKKKSLKKTPSQAGHSHIGDDSVDDLKVHVMPKSKNRDRIGHLYSNDTPRDKRNRRESKILRSKSPVVNSLLRMANDLNCEARDECEDECKFKNVRQKGKCEVKCEVEFECEKEETNDECDESQGDCGEETTTSGPISTQGERFFEDTKYCKRC